MGGMVRVIPPAAAPSGMDGRRVLVPFVDAEAETDVVPEAETDVVPEAETEVKLVVFCCLRCRPG
jgi:hypothetical protein